MQSRYKIKRRKKSNGKITIILLIILISISLYFAYTGNVGSLIADRIISPITQGYNTKIMDEEASTVPATASVNPTTFIAEGNLSTESLGLPATTMYAVQFGAYSTQNNARRAAVQLNNLGAAGYVLKENNLWRVLGALYTSEENATTVRDRIRSNDGLDVCIYTFYISPVNLNVTATDEQLVALGECFMVWNQTIEELYAMQFDIDKKLSLDECREKLLDISDKLAASANSLQEKLGETIPLEISDLLDLMLSSADVLDELSQNFNDKSLLSPRLKYVLIDLLVSFDKYAIELKKTN